MRFRRMFGIGALATAAAALSAACYLKPVDHSSLPDWTDATHGSSAAPDFEKVFPSDKVNRIDLVIRAADWNVMWSDMTSVYGSFGSGSGQPGGGQPGGGGGGVIDSEDNPVYVPASLFFEGRQWYWVGVRFKGNSSLRSAWSEGNGKLAFRLDFAQFDDDYPEIQDQRFFGFKELSLSNSYKDVSLLRDRVAPDIFRDAGVRAPHTAFYRLYVDHGSGPVYFGLYTGIEVIEDTMLEDQFGSRDGNAYKPMGTGATFKAGSFSEAYFVKKTNADLANWSDIQAVFAALHAGNRLSAPAAWRAGLEAAFNVDGFLKWLAVNTVIQNWDTYGKMNHNYYLYNDPAGPGLTWIPWDNNEALVSNNALSLTLTEVGSGWPLIRYAMDDPVYRAAYRDYVAAAVSQAFEPAAMESTYRRLHALIRPYVVGAEGEWSGYTFVASAAAFDAALTTLIKHAQTRYQAVQAFLGTLSEAAAR